MYAGSGMVAWSRACGVGPEVSCIRRFTYWLGSGGFGTRVGKVGLVEEALGALARLKPNLEINSGVVLPCDVRDRRWMLNGWDGWRRMGSVIRVAGLDGSRTVICPGLRIWKRFWRRWMIDSMRIRTIEPKSRKL
jgi:hypothetical protein